MTHVTCRLTAKNRDQLWNPTLCSRVWASFTFFTVAAVMCVCDMQLTMNDFSVHRIIGRGGFGEVYGCRKADTGKMSVDLFLIHISCCTFC